MAYATLDALKEYLNIEETTDDALLTRLLEVASTAIDNRLQKHFEGVTETRYFGPSCATGNVLFLDDYLLEVTEVKNALGDAIPIDEVRLLPYNSPRPYALMLTSSYTWGFALPEDRVEITGTWGYSMEPPEDIVQATIRLASYLYKLRDAQIFDVTATSETGQANIPKGFPKDVQDLLKPYETEALFA